MSRNTLHSTRAFRIARAMRYTDASWGISFVQQTCKKSAYIVTVHKKRLVRATQRTLLRRKIQEILRKEIDVGDNTLYGLKGLLHIAYHGHKILSTQEIAQDLAKIIKTFR